MKRFVSIVWFALYSLSWAAGFDGAEQAKSLSQALQEYYQLEGSLELATVAELAPLAERPDAVELLEVPAHIAANLPVRARFLKEKKSIGEIQTNFKAQWRVSALVARRPLNKGPLSVEDFTVQTIDRLTLNQVPVPPQETLEGQLLVGPLSTGTALCWSHLKAEPVIKKGSLVEVIAQEGGLKITTKAIATQDAGKSEAIVMRNVTTNRTFEAYVINENLVEIRL